MIMIMLSIFFKRYIYNNSMNNKKNIYIYMKNIKWGEGKNKKKKKKRYSLLVGGGDWWW